MDESGAAEPEGTDGDPCRPLHHSSRPTSFNGQPMAERVQRIGFIDTYNDARVEADATVLVGKSRIRYYATLLAAA